MLLSMTKVQIIATRRCLEPTVRHLHRLGVLQIEDLSTKPLPDVQTMTLDGAALHEKGDLGLLLAQTEALVDLLSPFTPQLTRPPGYHPPLPLQRSARRWEHFQLKLASWPVNEKTWKLSSSPSLTTKPSSAS